MEALHEVGIEFDLQRFLDILVQLEGGLGLFRGLLSLDNACGKDGDGGPPDRLYVDLERGGPVVTLGGFEFLHIPEASEQRVPFSSGLVLDPHDVANADISMGPSRTE